MNVLIDDERTRLPDGSVPDFICRSYAAGIDLMVAFTRADFLFETTLFIDHDLGTFKTGYDLVSWIEAEMAKDAPLIDLPYKIVCVSGNPPGRARIQQVIDN